MHGKQGKEGDDLLITQNGKWILAALSAVGWRKEPADSVGSVPESMASFEPSQFIADAVYVTVPHGWAGRATVFCPLVLEISAHTLLVCNSKAYKCEF